jgi:uncharacterized protein (TIGR03067 family)
MRKTLAGVAVFVLMAGTAVWGGDTKKDKEKLQGTWKLTQIELGGKKIDLPEGMSMQFIFTGDKVMMKGSPKGDEEGTYTLDAAKKPKQITLARSATSTKGPKGPRPTGFDDAMAVIMILKKAK